MSEYKFCAETIIAFPYSYRNINLIFIIPSLKNIATGGRDACNALRKEKEFRS